MTSRYKSVAIVLGALLIAVFAMGQSFNATLFSGYAQRAKPAPQPDSRAAGYPARFSRYGEPVTVNMVPNKVALADEGSYFVTGTTTSTSIGSGITMGTMSASTSFSATKGAFVIKNNDSTGGKRIYLDYIKLFNWTAAPTSATALNMAIELDNTSRSPSAPSGSTLTIVNPNMDDSTQSVAQAFGFVIATTSQLTVPAAGSAARQVTQCMLKSQIPVVRDSLEAYFGAVDGTGGTMGTTGGRFVTNCAPVIIGPQQWAVVHIWAPAAAADPITEYELAWWER